MLYLPSSQGRKELDITQQPDIRDVSMLLLPLMLENMELSA
jgi:hypothetical protein